MVCWDYVKINIRFYEFENINFICCYVFNVEILEDDVVFVLDNVNNLK